MRLPRPFRSLVCAVFIILHASLCILPLYAVQTDPGVPDLTTRETARAWHNQWWSQTYGAPMNYTGNAGAGIPGDLGLAYRQQALLRYNLFRRMVGSLPFVLDDAMNTQAQLAAMLSSANNDIEHNPPNTWKFWTKAAYDACNASNLALGVNEPEASVGYLYDFGRNNARVLGHREWQLAPWKSLRAGIGCAPAASGTSATQALSWPALGSLIEADAQVAQFKSPLVLWPCPGYVPHYLVTGQWSIALPDRVGSGYPDLTLRDVMVTVTRNGVKLPVDLSTYRSGLAAIWTTDGTLEGDSDVTRYNLSSGELFHGRPNFPQDIVYHVKIEGLRYRVPDPDDPYNGTADLGTGAPYNGKGVYEYDVIAYNPDLDFTMRFVTQPRSQSVAQGAKALLFAEATDATSYQWTKEGVAIPGATQAYLKIDSFQASDAGRYQLLAFGTRGALPSQWATLSLSSSPAPQRKLANISTRATVSSGDSVQIAGFVIGGSEPKTVLIRAGGLSVQNSIPEGGPLLQGLLQDPVLDLYRIFPETASNEWIARDDDWDLNRTRGDMLAEVAKSLQAFPFTRGSRDAVLLVSLPPGIYSAIVSGKNGLGGTAMVEVYDASLGDSSLLLNISTRSLVRPGDEVLIGGFVISGDQPRKVLIQGVGPSLLAAVPGFQGLIADPRISLFNSAAQLLATNDNWGEEAEKAAEIARFERAIGATVLLPGSKDAALILTLQPGPYSVHVAGANGTSGIGMVEIYENGE